MNDISNKEATRKRLKEIEDELASLKSQLNDMTSKWKNEKDKNQPDSRNQKRD